MGIAVFILGYSGQGKSASLRNFRADELALANVNGKPMPFRTRFKETVCTDNVDKIIRFMAGTKCKTIAVDDTQYIMANEYMRRAKETGYNKFTDIGQNMWRLIKSVEEIAPDKVVFFLSHIDTDDNGREKFKTVGKLLDEKINPEGMVSVVLKAVSADGKYKFATQTDGNDTCKSPIGLFDTMYIDNDAKYVDSAIRSYYGLVEAEKCEECGNDILASKGRSADTILKKSVEMFGKKLCWSCCVKHGKESGNAPKTVSE